MTKGTALSRPPIAPDFVRSIPERARSIGIDDMTLRRMIWRGDGPTIIKLSPGRIGIRDSHWNLWLKGREEKPRPSAAMRR
jgi:hypothetical protein